MEMDGSHGTFVMSVPKVGCYFCGTRKWKVKEVVEQMRRSDDSPRRGFCPENAHSRPSSHTFIACVHKMSPILSLNYPTMSLSLRTQPLYLLIICCCSVTSYVKWAFAFRTMIWSFDCARATALQGRKSPIYTSSSLLIKLQNLEFLVLPTLCNSSCSC